MVRQSDEDNGSTVHKMIRLHGRGTHEKKKQSKQKKELKKQHSVQHDGYENIVAGTGDEAGQGAGNESAPAS